MAELRLGLDTLAKELAEKGEVRRSRERPSGGSASGPEDAVLRSRVQRALVESPLVPAFGMDVAVEKGTVILTGRVGTLEQLQQALLCVLSLPEAAEVVSRLTVEPDDGSGITKGEGTAK